MLFRPGKASRRYDDTQTSLDMIRSRYQTLTHDDGFQVEKLGSSRLTLFWIVREVDGTMMQRNNRIRPVQAMIAIFVLFLLMSSSSGCASKNTSESEASSTTTSVNDTDQSGQLSESTATTTATTIQTSADPEPTTETSLATETTTSASSASESSIEETSESTEATTSSTTDSTEPTDILEINYQPLPAVATHLFDLNSDGSDDSIAYASVGDFDFTLTVNGMKMTGEGEFFLSNWFFVVDLDEDDPYMDIAIQELGPSSDFQVSLYYFDGARLVLRGKVQGLICDIFSETIDSDPFGSGTIQVDGRGGVISMTRGMILHTWFFAEPWKIGQDGLLHKVPMTYYPMDGVNPDTGERIPEFEVTMLMDLELVAAPDSSDVVATAAAGQAATLVQTDNVAWVQMRTQDGDLGWFYVEDYYGIPIGGTIYFASDVMDGLFFAD